MSDQSITPSLAAADRPTTVRYGVMTAMCVASAVAYLQRSCFATVESSISADIQLSKAELGLIMSSFFWAYAAFQIPSGWLGDRWGARRALSLYSAVWSVPTGLMALAGGFPSLAGAQIARGVGQAGIFPCCARIIGDWTSAGSKGQATGLLGASQQVGAILAMLLTPALLPLVGWRGVFALYAVPGVMWSVWFYWWFRDRPQDHPAVNEAELELLSTGRTTLDGDASATSPAIPWRKLLGSVSLWCVCLQQFFRAAGYVFFITWFPRYLQEAHGVSLKESGVLTAGPIVAGLIGGLTGGAVSDWALSVTGSRRLARQGVAIVGLLASATLILSTFLVRDQYLSVAIISAGAFSAALAGPSGYTVTIELSGRHVGTVFGTMNMSGNIGAAMFPAVVPWLMQAADWSATLGAAAPQFRQAGEWSVVILLFASLYVAAAICWLLVNPNGTFVSQSLVRGE